MLQNFGEKILRELGLTSSQARVYLTLSNLAYPSTAKTISTTSNIARQDIYHTLTELQKLSLVETVINNPTLFRAIPLQEAISILEKRKKQKMHDLIVEAKELLKISTCTQEQTIEQGNHEFVLIPKKERCINKVKKTVEAAQESILAVTSWREATQWLFMLHNTWERALNRNVKVQWITEKQENNNSLTESMLALLENSNLIIKSGPSFLPPDVRFAIYDGKEAFIATLNAQNAGDSPALWTNNPVVLCLLKDYFETKWSLMLTNRKAGNRSTLVKSFS
jgi:sugar-specific transcriptional regulator TrmB